jgi:hypothetical protein
MVWRRRRWWKNPIDDITEDEQNRVLSATEPVVSTEGSMVAATHEPGP